MVPVEGAGSGVVVSVISQVRGQTNCLGKEWRGFDTVK